jgi:ribosome-associated protein
MTTIDSFDFARIAAEQANEKLAVHIVGYDVRKITSVADVFLFIGGSSHIHVSALEDTIRENLRAAGASLIRTDGQRGHLWRVLDYGPLIIHIMDQKIRDYYGLERLWEQGKKLDLLKPPVAVKKAASPKKRVTKAKPAAKKKKPAAKKAAPKKKKKAKKKGA